MGVGVGEGEGEGGVRARVRARVRGEGEGASLTLTLALALTLTLTLTHLVAQFFDLGGRLHLRDRKLASERSLISILVRGEGRVKVRVQGSRWSSLWLRAGVKDRVEVRVFLTCSPTD